MHLKRQETRTSRTERVHRDRWGGDPNRNPQRASTGGGPSVSTIHRSLLLGAPLYIDYLTKSSKWMPEREGKERVWGIWAGEIGERRKGYHRWVTAPTNTESNVTVGESWDVGTQTEYCSR
jgi:hypothetical protein